MDWRGTRFSGSHRRTSLGVSNSLVDVIFLHELLRRHCPAGRNSIKVTNFQPGAPETPSSRLSRQATAARSSPVAFVLGQANSRSSAPADFIGERAGILVGGLFAFETLAPFRPLTQRGDLEKNHRAMPHSTVHCMSSTGGDPPEPGLMKMRWLAAEPCDGCLRQCSTGTPSSQAGINQPPDEQVTEQARNDGIRQIRTFQKQSQSGFPTARLHQIRPSRAIRSTGAARQILPATRMISHQTPKAGTAHIVHNAKPARSRARSATARRNKGARWLADPRRNLNRHASHTRYRPAMACNVRPRGSGGFRPGDRASSPVSWLFAF